MSASPWDLIRSSLKIGAIGFGGGSALIPVMHRQYVEREKLVDDDVFTTHVVVSNITPGAQPVKLAALAGTRFAQWWPSVVAALAVALPGTAATVALITAFTVIGPRAIQAVEFAAVGITCFIMVLLLNYISKVIRGARSTAAAVSIMLAAFVLMSTARTVRLAGALFGQDWNLALPQITALQLVLLTIAGAAVFTIITRRPTPPAEHAAQHGPIHAVRPAVALFLLAAAALGMSFVLGAGQFLALAGFSSIVSFGGGVAYVGVADGFFVGQSISSAEFYGQSVPVANAMPGPVLVKLAAAVGLSYGTATGGIGLGITIAALAMVVTVSLCSAVALLLMAGYEKAATAPFVRNLSAAILPAICGLLLGTMVSMLLASMDIAGRAELSAPATGWASILAVAALLMLHRRNISDLVLLGGAAATSLAAMWLLA